MWKFSQPGPVGVPQSKAVIALWARMKQLSTAPQYDAVTTITIIPRVLKLSIHLLPSNTITKHIFKDWTNTRLLYIWAHLLSLLQNVLPERFNYPGMHGCLSLRPCTAFLSSHKALATETYMAFTWWVIY